jgi:SAM-dependent methyltransferase|tara:strand:- start:65 stop:745 length:681 start_codon:yes stop_codon:yes gene_type:complete
MRTISLFSVFCITFSNTAESLNPVPYWFNPNIHVLGNTGLGGKLHANVAIIFTRLIDAIAYNNTNIRNNLLETIPIHYSVCDFGCGVGISTHDGVGSLGIDTSEEMYKVAINIFPRKRFEIGNAENYGDSNSFDYVSICFLFHEAPSQGREAILENSLRICKKGIIIMDISPNYKPSASMLMGEPFILDYCKNIEKEINSFAIHKNLLLKQTQVYPGRAHKWIIEK